jgi:hypothetical protein
MHSGEKIHVEKALENFAQLENIYVKYLTKTNINIFYGVKNLSNNINFRKIIRAS